MTVSQMLSNADFASTKRVYNTQVQVENEGDSGTSPLHWSLYTCLPVDIVIGSNIAYSRIMMWHGKLIRLDGRNVANIRYAGPNQETLTANCSDSLVLSVLPHLPPITINADSPPS